MGNFYYQLLPKCPETDSKCLWPRMTRVKTDLSNLRGFFAGLVTPDLTERDWAQASKNVSAECFCYVLNMAKLTSLEEKES